MALKKAIITVMLSALLVSSTAVPIYAVDDTDKAETQVSEEVEGNTDSEDSDEYTQFSEDTDLNDNNGDNLENKEDVKENNTVSKDENKKEQEQNSKEQSEINEDVKENNTVDKDENKNEQEQNSKEQSEIKEDGVTELRYTIDWGGPYIKAHYSNEPGYLDFSNVKISVYDNKSNILDSYNITDDILDSELDNKLFSKTVKIKNWNKNDYCIIKIDNLPEAIYGSRSQEIKIEYSENEDGVVMTDIYRELKTVDFNSMFYVYDINGKSIKNAEVAIEGYNGDDKVIYNKNVITGDQGLALLKINNPDIKYMKLQVNTVLNNSVVSGTVTTYFSYALASPSEPCISILMADTEYDGNIYDDEGNKVSERADIEFCVDYKSLNDMMIFKHKEININLYNNFDAFNTIILTPDKTSKFFSLPEGARYTVKTGDIIDYNLKLSNNTLIAKNNVKINVEAIPQMSLKVINEENGVYSNAHFKIVGYDKEFNEKQHIFSVNYNQGIDVINMDTGEQYTVFIEEYKETVLNIADGSKQNIGVINSDNIIGNGSVTENRDNKVINNSGVFNVPKTGDIIFSIIMIMIGVTGLFYIGYIYYRRKEKKTNEK